jgi:hypothetical protein
VWLPSRFPIIEPLKRRGWITVLDTGQSVVLRRAAGPVAVHAVSTPPGADTFPWP